MPDPFVQAIILVEDLTEGRRRMEKLGLVVLDGGRHPGRGTANLIVPLGTQYLELLAVVDRSEAESAPQGRPVLDALAARGPGLARWSVEPADIAVASARVGLPVESRQRVRPDGVVLHWESVGVDESWAAPWRCAFMSWPDPSHHPGRVAVDHPVGATGLASLELAVPNNETLDAWLGGPLPQGVSLSHAGDPGPQQLTLATPGGPLVVS